MLGIIVKIKNKVTDNLIGLMGENIKDSGLMANKYLIYLLFIAW